MQEKLGLTVCYRTDDEDETGIYVSEVCEINRRRFGSQLFGRLNLPESSRCIIHFVSQSITGQPL